MGRRGNPFVGKRNKGGNMLENLSLLSLIPLAGGIFFLSTGLRLCALEKDEPSQMLGTNFVVFGTALLTLCSQM